MPFSILIALVRASETVEGVMRLVSFLITASIFSGVFIGVALMSAVATGAVHSAVVKSPVNPQLR